MTFSVSIRFMALENFSCDCKSSSSTKFSNSFLSNFAFLWRECKNSVSNPCFSTYSSFLSNFLWVYGIMPSEYFVSVRHPRPQEVRHPHRENPTPIPHRWCMAAARIAHGRHAVGSFRNCVQPSHGLAFNGQYMRVVNDTVADGIGHGRIIKQLMPAGDVELRTEDSGCHLTPGFN